MSERVGAACDWELASSPSREPHKTNSANEQSDGHELYGDADGAVDELGLIVSPRLVEVMMYGRGRSVSSGALFMSSVAGKPKESRKDSRLCTNFERAKELNERVSTGRTCMRCALVGAVMSEANESPLWKGGVWGMYTEVALRELKKDFRFDRSSRRGVDEMRKGRLIVVTRMACFRRALSGISFGRKLTRPSNGRCVGSTSGMESCLALFKILDVMEGGLLFG